MPTIFDIIEAFQRMKESERRLGDIQTQASIAEPFALTQARRTLPMEQPTNEHLPLTPEIVPPQRMSRESAASRFGAPMEQPREPSAQMMAAQRFGAPMEQEPVPNAQAIMAALSGNTPSQEPTMNMGGGGGGGGGTDYASIAMNRFGDAYPTIIARAMEEAELRRQHLNMRRFGIPAERVTNNQFAANLGASKFQGAQQRVPTLAGLRMQSTIGRGRELFNASPAGQKYAKRKGGQSTPGLQPAAVPEQQNPDQSLAVALRELLDKAGF